jgi:hypothetical protein
VTWVVFAVGVACGVALTVFTVGLSSVIAAAWLLMAEGRHPRNRALARVQEAMGRVQPRGNGSNGGGAS